MTDILALLRASGALLPTKAVVDRSETARIVRAFKAHLDAVIMAQSVAEYLPHRQN